MTKLYKIIRNLFFFFLFLIPSFLLTVKINDLLYQFTQNSSFLYNFISRFLFVAFAIFILLVFNYVCRKIFNDNLRVTFIVLVIISFVVLGFANIDYFLGKSLGYESCGKEFNQAYLSAAESNDSSFCSNSNLVSNSHPGLKGGNYCRTPNKDYIHVENFKSYCIMSFSKYTKDLSHCEEIRGDFYYDQCIKLSF